jgi:hypothetical protein
MNATPEPETRAESEAAVPIADPATPLAIGVADLLGAWTRLLHLELALARSSLLWLGIGAIAVPVIGMSAWLGLSALLVATMQAYTDNWGLALLFGAGMQLLALAVLLRQLQVWAHDLSLPQSRAALVQALERMS